MKVTCSICGVVGSDRWMNRHYQYKHGFDKESAYWQVGIDMLDTFPKREMGPLDPIKLKPAK